MNQRPQQGGQRTQPSPGISPAEVKQLRAEIDGLKKLVQEHLAEKNQWNSIVRNWQGKHINVCLISGTGFIGKLLWMDRYTLCIETNVENETKPVIIHKAAVSHLYQEPLLDTEAPPSS